MSSNLYVYRNGPYLWLCASSQPNHPRREVERDHDAGVFRNYGGEVEAV